jgi:SNF2 family DNA or RNA helicase
MTTFVPGGPKRYQHQIRGLKKMIDTNGVTALLFDPGTGKTATALDYASILSLKLQSGEARVLVVCPLAAVDTWVIQARQYVSPDVNVWAEALSGSLIERARALAARGGNPMNDPEELPPMPSWINVRYKEWRKKPPMVECTICVEKADDPDQFRLVGADAKTLLLWWMQHVKDVHPEWRPRKKPTRPFVEARAAYHDQSVVLATRPQMDPAYGPDILPSPRLVLEVINLDTLQSRLPLCRRHLWINCPFCDRQMLMSDLMVQAMKRYQPDLVIVDESHKIKSVSGNASRVLARTVNFVKRRVLLTGTVMPLGPEDVFAQWRFLQPYAFGTKMADGSTKQATFGSFRSRFVQMGGWMGKEVVGYQNLDEMQRIMAENAVVARKEESLDLPKTTEVIIPVHLSPQETQAYEDMRDDLAATLDTGDTASTGNRLTQMLRLRQITSGFIYDDQGGFHDLGSSKVKVIESIANDNLAGEKRIVIFSFFTHEIDMISAALGRENKNIMEITGETDASDRIKMREQFGSDSKDRFIMVAQIKTMSLAVNELVTASHAIFGSLSQQRDDLIQGMDRLNRIGQTRPVTFWFPLAPGTVYEVILTSHKQRGDLEAAMLKHIREGGKPTAQPMRDTLAMFGGAI